MSPQSIAPTYIELLATEKSRLGMSLRKKQAKFVTSGSTFPLASVNTPSGTSTVIAVVPGATVVSSEIVIVLPTLDTSVSPLNSPADESNAMSDVLPVRVIGRLKTNAADVPPTWIVTETRRGPNVPPPTPDNPPYRPAINFRDSPFVITRLSPFGQRYQSRPFETPYPR